MSISSRKYNGKERVSLSDRADKPMQILNDLKALGYAIALEGDYIQLRYIGISEQPAEGSQLIQELRAHKPEAVEYLKAHQPKPNIFYGDIRIPFGSDRRYWWWAGGQPVEETIEEVLQWDRLLI